MKESLWIRIKRLFGFEISKPPHEDLRHRFNRIRMSSGYQPTRTKEELDYNLRFNLQNMLEDTIVPVRENELEQSKKE
jgi:hypothetical protein